MDKINFVNACKSFYNNLSVTLNNLSWVCNCESLIYKYNH